MLASHCANCEETLEGPAVAFRGEAYCCHGCAAGGPCVCPVPVGSLAAEQRRDTGMGIAPADPGELVRRAARFEDVVEHLAARRPENEPTSEPQRQPEHDERPSDATGDTLEFPARRIIALRAARFVDQQDLLLFAYLLELEPAIAEVALTRADVEDAWFAVRAHTLHDVMIALERVDGFELECTAHDASVEANVIYRSASALTLLDPRAATGGESVLPRRRRFRVFRHQPDESMHPAAEAPPETLEGDAAPVPRDGERAPAATGQLTLMAQPFYSFKALNEFQAAVRALHGVESALVRRFNRGTLHLAVEYSDPTPFVDRLRDLTAVEWRLVGSSGDEIELRVEPGR